MPIKNKTEKKIKTLLYLNLNLVGKNLNTLLDLIFITLPFQQCVCLNKSAKSISYICYSYARLYLLFFFIGIMMYWKKLWCVCLLLKALEELKCNRYLKGPVCEQRVLASGSGTNSSRIVL
jgi:hypothetical protein